MLRVAHTTLAANRAVFKRSLASSVLLSRSWENQTVAQLRQETKARGLSSSGTKASLIQRLKTFEEKKAEEARAPAAPTPAAKRDASTTAAPSRPVAAIDPNIFNIKIPDLSQPDPEIPVQIPFVPDFWDSAHQPVVPQLESSAPKLLVVAGATTHHAGGPSHNSLPDAQETTEGASKATSAAPPVDPSEGGIFFDIAADLGFLSSVPAPKPARKPFWQLFA